MRVARSRPRASVAIGCSIDGGWWMTSSAVFSGSYGERTDAKAHTSASAPSTKMLATARRCCTKRSYASVHVPRSRGLAPSRLGVADTGVEIPIQHIREKVRQDDQGRRDREDPHQDRIVAACGRIPEEASHAWPAEDLLRHERTSEEPGKVERCHGHERDRGVLQGVAEHDHSLLETLRACGPHEILIARLQHAGAQN